MNPTWRKEWEGAQARVEERRRLLERAASQRQRDEELEQRCAQLHRQYELELEDVEKLQGLGFQALWRTVMGDRKELLKREEAEAAEAKIRYRDACAERDLRREKLTALEAQAVELEGAEKEVEALSLRREQELRLDSGPRGREVDSLLRQRDELLRERQEIKEAQAAGDDAGTALDKAHEILQSAGRWGLYDMLGGGLIATAIKHGKLDEARKWLEDAGHALWDFEQELRDVGEISLPTIDLEPLHVSLDYFLDGFLVDAFVQNRITRARDHARSAAGEVEEIQRGLDRRRAEIDEELERGRTRLGELVGNDQG